jgi:hypothetical protein
MISSRLLVLYDKKDLTALVQQDMSKEEAMIVVKCLRKLKMPQPFYNTLADALSSTDADKYGEELERWNPLVTAKLNLLNG